MLSNGRFLCKKVDSLPKVFGTKISEVRHCRSQAGKQIVIPARIERGPTDILKELALTVQVDPTAFHYKFLDDPYFYPYTKIDKKIYALALESGRKSAKWIVKENPGFFKHQLADPPIKVFIPEDNTASESECTEKTLLNAIDERNVSEAIRVFGILKDQKQGITKSTKQSLLELVCFYDSEDRPDMEPEMKWLEGFLGKAGANLTGNTWKLKGFAECLFKDMDSRCSLANSAIIQGMLRHKEINDAMKLFKTANGKEIKLSVDVYNYIMVQASAGFVQRNEICQIVKDVLTEMSMRNVRPNLGTLNAAFQALSETSEAGAAMKLMKEFLDLGIEPSLGTYGYLIRIVGRIKSERNEIQDHLQFYRDLAKDIFSLVENKNHEIQHPSDYEFFVNAMEGFAKGMGDPDLSLRLLEMYLKPSNRKFVVRGAHDHGVFQQVIEVIFRTKPIDFSMDIYRRYALTHLTMVPRIFRSVISAVRENLASEYLPEIWEHICMSDCSEHRPILGALLNCIDDFMDESSLKVFHEAAVNLLKVVTDDKRFCSGDENYLPYVLMVFVKNEDDKRLLQTLTFIRNSNLQFLNMNNRVVEACVEYGLTKKSVPVIVESLHLAQREQIPAVGVLAEKALPLLSGEDKAFAELLTRVKDETRKRKESRIKVLGRTQEESVGGRDGGRGKKSRSDR